MAFFFFFSQHVFSNLSSLRNLRLDARHICIWRENVKSVIGIHTFCNPQNVWKRVVNPEEEVNLTLAGLQCISFVVGHNFNLGFVDDE